MIRSYESELASEVGVLAALIFGDVYTKAKVIAGTDNLCEVDVSCAARDFTEKFSEFSKEQVYRAIKKLEKSELLSLRARDVSILDTTRVCRVTEYARELVESRSWRFVL